MISLDSRIAAVALALLLLWAPLPFGSITPSAEFALQLGVSLVLLLLCVAGHVRGTSTIGGTAFAISAVAVLGVAQAVHWPRAMVALLSPEHARLMAAAAGLAGAAEARPALSVAPVASIAAALGFGTAALAMIAGAAIGRDRGGRRLLAGAILGAGLFQVIYGTQQWFSRSRDIWGVDVSSNPARLRGSFVNPNHFAVYVGIAMAVAFAWLWRALRAARSQEEPARRLLLVAPPLVVWLTLFAGLAFSESRSGLLAALGGVALQGFLIAAAKRNWRWAPLGLVLAVLALAVVAGIGMRQGLSRALNTSAFDGSWNARLEAWGAAFDLWQRFPWLGSGLGTFRDAFPLTQPASVQGTWDHAHNDLLELLATSGLVGTLLVAVGLTALLLRLSAVLRLTARSEDRAAPLAALGALVTCAIHGLFDFGITMPAIALTLATVCGAGAAPPLGPRPAKVGTT